MLSEDIDEVFRQKLDGHATPPGNDLWARLQLPADDKEPLDTLFREGLNAHATPLAASCGSASKTSTCGRSPAASAGWPPGGNIPQPPCCC